MFRKIMEAGDEEDNSSTSSGVVRRRLPGSPNGSNESTRSSIQETISSYGGSQEFEFPANQRIYARIEQGMTRCKTALEDAWNRLIGSEQNGIKASSQLRATGFVLAYTVHDFIGDATRISTGLEEYEIVKILNQLHALSLELDHLLKDSQQFLQGAGKFHNYCYQFVTQPRRRPTWLSRFIHPRPKAPSEISQTPTFTSSDIEDIVWILFAHEDPTESKGSSLTTFSQLPRETKLELLTCLLSKYRLLIATAHRSLQNAQHAFSSQVDSAIFLNFSIRRLKEDEIFGENLIENNMYRELMQKVFPTSRCLISLGNSISQVTGDANVIIKLTESFVSKMKANLFRPMSIKGVPYQCWDWVTPSASVVWRKIEIRLQGFVNFTGVDTMAIVIDNGSLLLRKYPKVLRSASPGESTLDLSNEDVSNNNDEEAEGIRSPGGDFTHMAEEVNPGASPPAEQLDLEVNFSQFLAEDMANNNTSGPTLIQLDFSHCPQPPPEEDLDDFIDNNNPVPIPEPESTPKSEEELPEYSPLTLSFYTISFLLLMYKWISRYHPTKLQELEKNASVQFDPKSSLEYAGRGKNKKSTVENGKRSDVLPVAEMSFAERAGRRKSSIPFADRTPKVRFNRYETMITSTKPGPHQPVLPGSNSEEELMKVVHSILKETEHPILIDLTMLTFEKPTGNILTNDEMLLCIAMLEWQCKIVAKADRLGRGAMDIISFPTSADRVEIASRINGILMISIDLMHELYELDLDCPSYKNNLDEMPRVMESLVNATDLIQVTARMFLRDSELTYRKWHDLLKKKGEFHVEHHKMRAPLYQTTMPENVTIYEANQAESTQYSTEGTLSVFWNRRYMTISSDMNPTPLKVTDFAIAEQLYVLNNILKFGAELIRCSDKQLKTAVEVFHEPILKTGFDNIKARVVGMQLDPNIDPLCALDLKNTLVELAQRNSELLNCAEQTSEAITKLVKLVQKFDRYAKQFLRGEKEDTRKCKCCRSYVLVDDLAELVGRLPSSDILTSMPLPMDFIMPSEEKSNSNDGSLNSRSISIRSASTSSTTNRSGRSRQPKYKLQL